MFWQFSFNTMSILRFKVCILAINNSLQILIKQVKLINHRVLDSAFRSVTKLDPTAKLWYPLQGKETLWVYLFTFFPRLNKYWCNLSLYYKTLLNWNTWTVLWNFTKKNESKSRKEKRFFLNVLAEFLLLENHLCNVYEAWIQRKKNCLSKKNSKIKTGRRLPGEIVRALNYIKKSRLKILRVF